MSTPMILPTDPTYPLLPIFLFLALILCLIPLPWHIQAWNSGTCAFMIWVALWCLNGFVNALVWRGNLDNPAPVWCDISAKFEIGATIGIPAAILCISRRIWSLVSGSAKAHNDKRRMMMIDLSICVGVPVIIMILHYIVQDHRFDILEDVGCQAVTYNTPLAYVLVHMWPVVFGVISLVYSALTFRVFYLRRSEFNRFNESRSSIDLKRYSRLGIFACLDVVCTVPLGIYSIYAGPRSSTLHPWVSWDVTHANFSRIRYVPTSEWRSDPKFHFSVELMRWLHVFCALLFFVAFGLTKDSRLYYRGVFERVWGGPGYRDHKRRPSRNLDSTLDSKGSTSFLKPPGTWGKPFKMPSFSTSKSSLSSARPPFQSSFGSMGSHYGKPLEAKSFEELEPYRNSYTLVHQKSGSFATDVEVLAANNNNKNYKNFSRPYVTPSPLAASSHTQDPYPYPHPSGIQLVPVDVLEISAENTSRAPLSAPMASLQPQRRLPDPEPDNSDPPSLPPTPLNPETSLLLQQQQPQRSLDGEIVVLPRAYH